MSQWYYVESGERIGPVDHHTLVSKLGRREIPADSLVWRDGMTDWAPASSFPELSAPAGGVATLASPPPGPIAGDYGQPHHPAGSFGSSAAQGGYDPFSGEQYGVVPISYAGFWKRFAAFLLDFVILMIFIIPMTLILVFAVGMEEPELVNGIAQLISTLGSVIYYTLFEASGLQATPGKLAVGIKVTDLNGNRISLLRAFGRNLGKWLSQCLLFFGFIMAGFTEKKQALHDMIAGCLVINR